VKNRLAHVGTSRRVFFLITLLAVSIVSFSSAVTVKASAQVNLLTSSGWRDSKTAVYTLKGTVDNSYNYLANKQPEVNVSGYFEAGQRFFFNFTKGRYWGSQYDVMNGGLEPSNQNFAPNVSIPPYKEAWFDIVTPSGDRISVDVYCVGGLDAFAVVYANQSVDFTPLEGGNLSFADVGVEGDIGRTGTYAVTATAIINPIYKDATHTYYIDTDPPLIMNLWKVDLTGGYYHVSGEVDNEGDGFAGAVNVTATFFDSNNREVATSSTNTLLNVVPPESKSPFEVLLNNTEQSAKVSSYGLSITFSSTSSIPSGLDIPSNSSYIDETGHMNVGGSIRNIASGTATDVKVIVTFYNSTGNVVATVYVIEGNLSPNQTKTFDVILTDNSRVPLAANYTLSAQSNEYLLTSENAALEQNPFWMQWWLWTIIALGVATFLLALTTVYYRRKTVSKKAKTVPSKESTLSP
jgi:hypothetical protein